MMFVWFSSNNGRPNVGCCGGTLLLLPLSFLTFFGGFGDSGFLLMLLIVGVLAVMFVLPRFTSATESGGKRKNDELYGDYDEYNEKPKRDEEQYILTDDGEIIRRGDHEEGLQ